MTLSAARGRPHTPSPGNRAPSGERGRGKPTVQVRGGRPELTWLPPPRPTACRQGLGIPRAALAPEKTPREAPPSSPAPDTGGPVGTLGWACERPGGEDRGGSARWHRLTLLPVKRRWRRCPLPCPLTLPPASCLPHLITEMSSPEGSLLLLTVPRYLPPAASAAILVTGGEPAGCNGAKAVRTLQLTSPRAHQ